MTHPIWGRGVAVNILDKRECAPPIPTAVVRTVVASIDGHHNDVRHYFVDGSGGSCKTDPRLERLGFGAAQIRVYYND